MSILYMMVAPPGSGKSTWVNKYSSTVKANVVCPDLIRKELTGDISNISRDKDVWDIAKDRVRLSLSMGENVILDATNCKTKYRNAFLKKVKFSELWNIEVKFILFKEVNPTICKMRIANDLMAGKDRSKVPAEIVDNMYKDYTNSLGYLMKNNPNDIIWVG